MKSVDMYSFVDVYMCPYHIMICLPFCINVFLCFNCSFCCHFVINVFDLILYFD